MKLIKFLLFYCLLSACSGKTINSKYSGFDYLATKEKCLILSCTKCDCVVRELNKCFLSNNKIFSNTIIYADTNCLGNLNKQISVSHINQKKIDSISVDFYNVLILTKDINSSTMKYKNITTEESENIKSFL